MYVHSEVVFFFDGMSYIGLPPTIKLMRLYQTVDDDYVLEIPRRLTEVE